MDKKIKRARAMRETSDLIFYYLKFKQEGYTEKEAEGYAFMMVYGHIPR